MKIVQYPHPTLRHKSKPVKRIDAELRRVVAEMFDLMYEANGIGLAANQVDLPLRLFVTNPTGDREQDTEFVFINPVVSRPKGTEEKEEGCLSLPGLYANVKRPQRVHVTAYNLQGEEYRAELDGLFARVVQHETDHLDGVLFIDRLSETESINVREELDEFVASFEDQQKRNLIPPEDEIQSRLSAVEEKYC